MKFSLFFLFGLLAFDSFSQMGVELKKALFFHARAIIKAQKITNLTQHYEHYPLAAEGLREEEVEGLSQLPRPLDLDGSPFPDISVANGEKKGNLKEFWAFNTEGQVVFNGYFSRRFPPDWQDSSANKRYGGKYYYYNKQGNHSTTLQFNKRPNSEELSTTYYKTTYQYNPNGLLSKSSFYRYFGSAQLLSSEYFDYDADGRVIEYREKGDASINLDEKQLIYYNDFQKTVSIDLHRKGYIEIKESTIRYFDGTGQYLEREEMVHERMDVGTDEPYSQKRTFEYDVQNRLIKETIEVKDNPTPLPLNGTTVRHYFYNDAGLLIKQLYEDRPNSYYTIYWYSYKTEEGKVIEE